MALERAEETLKRVEALLNRVLDDSALRRALADVAFSPKELEQGMAQLNAALEVTNRYQTLTRTLDAAEKAFDGARRDAKKRLQKDCQIAEAVVTDDMPFKVVVPPTSDVEEFEIWHASALDFYNSALENQELLEVLCRYGLKQSRLKVGTELLEAARLSHAAKVQAEEEAHRTAEQLDEVLDDLSQWEVRLTASLRKALQNDAGKLRSLGL